MDLKVLRTKRSSVKGRATKFSNYIDLVKDISSLTPIQVADLRIKLTKIEALSNEFDDIQQQIEVLSSDNLELELEERYVIEQLLDTLIATATHVLSQHDSNNCNQSVSSGHSQCQNNPVSFKLPQIQITKFSGNYSRWMEFKDMFSSLIHSNNQILPIHKFQYLKSYLEGDALNVISNLEISAVNYSKAWSLLCERFDNKRQLVNNHLNALFNIEPVCNESATALRSLIDNYNKNLRALASLGEPTTYWDTLIIYMMSNKLDSNTTFKWEEFRKTLSEMPKLEQFTSFLRDRADILETCTQNKSNNQRRHSAPPQSSANKYQYQQKPFTKSFSVTSTSEKFTNKNILCLVCKGRHFIYDCPSFLSKTPEQRKAEATRLKLCHNCLRIGHTAYQCKLGSCRECKRRHNSLLHFKTAEIPVNTVTAAPPDDHNGEASTSSAEVSVGYTSQPACHVLLSTALVRVINPETQQTGTVRALLDSGSQASFITNDLKLQLGLKSLSINPTKIIGIGNSSSHYVTERCVVQLKSNYNKFSATLACSVLPELTGYLPRSNIDLKHFNIPANIQLADPSFNYSRPVQMLIGSDLFWEIIGSEQKSLGTNKPFLRNSQLGWIVSGPIFIKCEPRQLICNFSASHSSLENLNNQIARFWEIEDLPKCPSLLSDSEKACEQHFCAHTRRLQSGRFVVKLPLVSTPDCLGDSYKLAKRRFLSLEKRFRKQPQLKKAYCDFISEYRELGHCTESPIDIPETYYYFLCHHAVLREQSESTKCRVVFDGSAPTTSGFSINDLQMVGANIQDSLFSILIRFRQYKYVLSGDVEKMFRQVLVHEDDRNLQLILWRENENEPIKTLVMNTVTYGFASATFLTTRCLWQLGEECGDELSKVIIQKDFYCDDLITGADSEQDLLLILNSVSSILKGGCFNLRKFRSNIPNIFSQSSQINLQDNLSLSESSSALGLGWSPTSDCLHFTINLPTSSDQNITKRFVMSTSFKIFDPLGLLSPCTVQPKLLIQQLWIKKLDWDETIPHTLKKDWDKIVNNYPHLSSIQIPRQVLIGNATLVELHTFSDASLHAYGACIYARSTNERGQVKIMLLCAKSKVAPVKPTTIPRLELCGALLAARLHKTIVESLRLHITQSFHWCDSSVVLGWLNANPSSLKMFVANRVVEITDTTSVSSWRYVPTDTNPADLISRGTTPQILKESDLWWSGPAFLKQEKYSWPVLPSRPDIVKLPEMKSFSVDTEPSVFNIENYSTFRKLKRVFAYILRAMYNFRNPKSKHSGPLTVEELENSFLLLCKLSQRQSFPKEYNLLLKNKSINCKSNILSLNPFLDKNQVMRVGGRLSHSSYDYDKKHQIILNASSHLTRLIFNYEHIRHMHAGPQLLLCTIREYIWPVSGRRLARRIVKSCVTCRRFSNQALLPMMGQLPSQRVTPSYPFHTVGMDFAGPFTILNKKGRGAKTSKCYLCLFICFAYKCVHLEAVTELSKEAFVLALRRFISRRGKPLEIFSDNGRNFTAAAKDIGDFLGQNSSLLSEYAANENFKFTFIPAYAPHFGGLWEAGIKSAKHHIKRILGNTNLTYEELSTLFAQVEAILNSRPLCPMSSSPHDFLSLTPGHFLIGRPMTSLPSPTLQDYSPASLDRYRRLEQLRQQFWNRWQREYVSELQQRCKWRYNRAGLNVGDLVLIKEDHVAPLQWRLGRVAKLYPGDDGISRVADVDTVRGRARRPLVRLCPLPSSEDFKY